jgi:hypothetical protein
MGDGTENAVNHSRKYRKCILCVSEISENHFFCDSHAHDEFVNYCYLCDTRNVTFDIPPRHYSWTDGVRGSSSARWGAELRVVGGKVCDNCDGEMKHGMEKSQQSFREYNLKRFDSVEVIALISLALICIISLFFAFTPYHPIESFVPLVIGCITGLIFFAAIWESEEQLEERNRAFHVAWTKHELEKHKLGFYLSPHKD